MEDQIRELESRLSRRSKDGEAVAGCTAFGALLASIVWLVSLGALIDSYGTIGRGAFTSSTIALLAIETLRRTYHRKTERMRSELRDLRMVAEYDRREGR